MSDAALGHGELARALFTSADHLHINLDVLDNLNVFPVPDGDTGSNMGATFIPAVKELKQTSVSSCMEIGRVLVPRMDNHSRGNSGFIISRFFKGFFASCDESLDLTVAGLKEGFSRGYFEAHTALFNPVEGTMISVISAMTESIGRWTTPSVHGCLENAVAAARETLFRTPAMLPVLARAGVVDSGALGFICIIEGLLLGLQSREPYLETEESYRFSPDPEAGEASAEILAGQFCTELTARLKSGFPEEEIRDYLRDMGNSIALVREGDFLKLHIHTDFPEQVINKIDQFGTIESQKIDDIHAQIRGGSGSGEDFRGCEVIPIVPGPGFETLFHELGVENVLVYGTSLPSVIEILEAVERAGVDDILLLPNDRNILPACMTVKKKSSRHISILPTGDVVEGMAAFYGFSENEELEPNTASMEECMSLSVSLFLHRSAADRSFGGVELKKDDYFLTRGKDILSVHSDISTAVIDGLARFDLSDKGNITLFHKDDTADAAEALAERLGGLHPHLEIEVLYGGQARGELILSLE